MVVPSGTIRISRLLCSFGDEEMRDLRTSPQRSLWAISLVAVSCFCSCQETTDPGPAVRREQRPLGSGYPIGSQVSGKVKPQNLDPLELGFGGHYRPRYPGVGTGLIGGGNWKPKPQPMWRAPQIRRLPDYLIPEEHKLPANLRPRKLPASLSMRSDKQLTNALTDSLFWQKQFSLIGILEPIPPRVPFRWAPQELPAALGAPQQILSRLSPAEKARLMVTVPDQRGLDPAERARLAVFGRGRGEIGLRTKPLHRDIGWWHWWRRLPGQKYLIFPFFVLPIYRHLNASKPVSKGGKFVHGLLTFVCAAATLLMICDLFSGSESD